MLPIILQAAENFCIHQLRLSCQPITDSPQKRTLLAYIDVEAGDGTSHRVFVGCDFVLMQMITEMFLGEDESDEQTLIDMLLETTNMIVGSAKVLAEESYEQSMTIATPFFVSEEVSQNRLGEMQRLGIENGEMMIALQRL
ncbi:chemotaxis protein CheX [Sulfuricurvum sp.]|jgi:hypothetical protein|uniref:chemotaxis protein CheX n=1 Tax=Sulfuricurvum sp. TaxID=2025608 RepID=UPI002616E18A|nr:chemotaxis protein CheX [Sulfuricurvum sp.]MDD3595426.1 chemotaxis protein CheX [Sulfuricurvum sp.]MDD4884980.1 chemotaxis protein CheX [Sulfuricurvum sp.]